MKKLLLICLAVAMTLVGSPNIYGFTSLDLMGEYSLVGFTIQYPGYSAITQDDASSFSGRASITTTGFVTEMSGYIAGNYIWNYNCAFYTVYGNRIYASIVGESSGYIDIQLSGNSLVTSGYDYDSDGDYFNYVYTWTKNKTYYTQEQADQAIVDSAAAKDAIIAQKDQAISEKSQIISNLNETINEKEQTISVLNDIITQKNQIISAMSDFNADGVLDLKDIIFGLQVFTGLR